jgi:hypothetical protein
MGPPAGGEREACETMKAIAKDTLTYGKNGESVKPGEEFECPDELVDDLAERGLIESPTKASKKSSKKEES